MRTGPALRGTEAWTAEVAGAACPALPEGPLLSSVLLGGLVCFLPRPCLEHLRGGGEADRDAF